jgi:spore coat polysaccharide biosynthesis protein SpsF
VDERSRTDYASNVLRRTYPKGLDAEALFMDTLRRIDRLGTSKEAREHVTWFAYRERPDLFLLRSVEQGQDYSALNWSVDTSDDLERVRRLYARLDLDRNPRGWGEVAAADSNP